MEEYLLEIIRTGENGNIYRCLVLKTDNQKLKVRDAWTWVHNTFNLRFGTQFNKEFLRKKYSYLRAKTRSKAVSNKEVTNKQTAKTFAEFRRLNNRVYLCICLCVYLSNCFLCRFYVKVQIWLLSAFECERRGRLYVTTCVRTCRGLQEEKLDCWILFNFFV